MCYITDFHTVFYHFTSVPHHPCNRSDMCHHELLLFSDMNKPWKCTECFKASSPQWQNCMTAQDIENMASILSRYLYAKTIWGIVSASPRKPAPFVGVNASSRSDWGGRSDLFDWSATGLSDTVAKITATQHVQSRIKACTVNIPPRKQRLKSKFGYTSSHRQMGKFKSWCDLKWKEPGVSTYGCM